MSRPLRLEFSGAYYHVINRGMTRQAIFQDEEDRRIFLKLLAEVHARWNLQIYAYCLMSNHYQLSVQTPTIFLSRIMRHINGVYTQKYNRRHKRDGPLFRGRYKAILVEKGPCLLSVVRHIHQDPFEPEKKKVSQAYRSSSRYYITDRGKPPWLNTETVMSCFGGDRERLFKFMAENEPSDNSGEKYLPEVQGPLFGSEDFKKRIRSQAGFKAREPEIPEKRYLAVAIDTCIKTVSNRYKTDVLNIKRSRRGERNEPRQVAMYISREAGGYRHREIAEAFQAGSYSTVSSACALIKKRMKKEDGFRERVMTIYNEIIGQ